MDHRRDFRLHQQQRFFLHLLVPRISQTIERTLNMKNMNTMTLLAAGTCAMIAASAANAAMVARWDFQTTTNGGTAILVSPATPKVFVANFGSGSLYLDGNNGSSNFFVPATGSTNTEINGLAGTPLNATGSMSTVATSPSALAVLGGATSGATSAANGKSMVFKFSMTNLQNLAISFAAQRTSTGFTGIAIDASTNGTSWSAWTTLASSYDAGAPVLYSGAIKESFVQSGVISLSTTSLLDNATTAYVRFTFTGATSASGNNRFDNFQFNAGAIPAPGAIALLGVAGLVGARRRR